MFFFRSFVIVYIVLKSHPDARVMPRSPGCTGNATITRFRISYLQLNRMKFVNMPCVFCDMCVILYKIYVSLVNIYMCDSNEMGRLLNMADDRLWTYLEKSCLILWDRLLAGLPSMMDGFL